jgi:hypothetical protein
MTQTPKIIKLPKKNKKMKNRKMKMSSIYLMKVIIKIKNKILIK